MYAQLFVHFNNEAVSGVKKGRINGKKGEVVAALGTTHAEYSFEEQKECSVDAIFTRMQKVPPVTSPLSDWSTPTVLMDLV